MVSGESQGLIPRMPSGSQSRCWGGEAEPHGWLVLRTGHLISHLVASASLPQGPGNEEGLVGTPSIVMMTTGWRNHLGAQLTLQRPSCSPTPPAGVSSSNSC